MDEELAKQIIGQITEQLKKLDVKIDEKFKMTKQAINELSEKVDNMQQDINDIKKDVKDLKESNVFIRTKLMEHEEEIFKLKQKIV